MFTPKYEMKTKKEMVQVFPDEKYRLSFYQDSKLLNLKIQNEYFLMSNISTNTINIQILPDKEGCKEK